MSKPKKTVVRVIALVMTIIVSMPMQVWANETTNEFEGQGNAQAIEQENQGQIDIIPETEEVPVESVTEGFVCENGQVSYYLQGEAVKNVDIEIDGYVYRFDADGYLKLGLQEDVAGVDGETHSYFYTSDAPYVWKGEKRIDGNWHYFDKKTGEMRTGFVVLSDGRTVYYDVNGIMLYGTQDIEGKKYYFNTVTGSMKTGLATTEDGEKIYYGPDGALKSGEVRIDGRWYYFDENNYRMVKDSFVTLSDGRIVYYDENGVMVHGEKRIDGNWYYFHEVFGTMQTGFCKLPTKTVYYDQSGKMLYGTIEIDGFTYNFDKVTGAMETGWKVYDGQKYYYSASGITKGELRIGDYWYYFDEKTAVLQTGWVKHHGYSYYYNSDGQMQYGEQRIENEWYYFHVTRGIMQTGWVKHHGNQYYYDADGKMYHGWNEVEGVTYLFNKVTGVFKPGWRKEADDIYYYKNDVKYAGELLEDGAWYYFDPLTDGKMATGWTEHDGKKYFYAIDGKMCHGWTEVEGITYLFDKVTGVFKPEWRKENGKIYFLENGKKYVGEKRIEGHWYYFNAYGEMVIGWQKLSDGRTVYYGSDGTMKYGEQRIGGKWHFFNTVTGAMVKGWYNLPGKKVYYGSDGAMVYGTQTINGKTYTFNKVTGALILNGMAMKAQRYSSNTKWLILVDTKKNRVGIYSGYLNHWNTVKDWSCTTGASSTPTVKGTFTIKAKGKSFGSGYTCWYYTQFYGNYLFHSVLYKQGSMSVIKDGRLGINASHGCVRLALSNAKWIYNNIPRGTKVVIY